jgi:dinuclear metal center YbgI/SA1388 family protein
MAQLHDMVLFLDHLLDTARVPEKYATNGLQVEGAANVERVGLCVDASLETFTALSDCQLIVVHHGLFWPTASRITGALHRSLKFLLERNIALYASHLPLDVHADVGNNAQIVEQLGLKLGTLFPPVGYLADCDSTAAQLHQLVEQKIGNARLLDFGPHVRKIAVSSGQASVGMVDQAKAAGVDLLLTGEASHPIYHAAQEAGLGVILAGHYATETWGVKALGQRLEQAFSVRTRFVDVPTGF